MAGGVLRRRALIVGGMLFVMSCDNAQEEAQACADFTRYCVEACVAEEDACVDAELNRQETLHTACLDEKTACHEDCLSGSDVADCRDECDDDAQACIDRIAVGAADCEDDFQICELGCEC